MKGMTRKPKKTKHISARDKRKSRESELIEDLKPQGNSDKLEKMTNLVVRRLVPK